MSGERTARAAAQLTVMATEAAGEALASGASDRAVVLAGQAVAAMARIQRRLIERHGVVHAAWLMRQTLEGQSDVLLTCDEADLIDEIRGWYRESDAA